MSKKIPNRAGYSNRQCHNRALQYIRHAIKVEYNNLQSLDISNFDFTFEGINFIAEALKSKYKKLKFLRLSANNFNEEGANIIADAIADRDCNVQKLDLSYCKNFVEDFKRFFEVIFKGKTNIKVFNIKQGDFNSRSYDYVIELIQKYDKKIVSISHVRTFKYGDKIIVCCYISKN